MVYYFLGLLTDNNEILIRQVSYLFNLFFGFIYFLVFLDWVCLCSSGCPGTHSVDQADLKLTEIHPPLPSDCWDQRRAPLPPPGMREMNYFKAELEALFWGVGRFEMVKIIIHRHRDPRSPQDVYLKYI